MPKEAPTEQIEQERGSGAVTPKWVILFVKAVPDNEEGGSGSIVSSIFVEQDRTAAKECEAFEMSVEKAILAVIQYRVMSLPKDSVLRLVTLHEHVRHAWEKGYEDLKAWEARGWARKANAPDWCGLQTILRQDNITISATPAMSPAEVLYLTVELREMISKFKLLRKHERSL